ncbi:diguanylate cyclase [Desulfovibrio sulfodismutans]|uniref:diguanylate cyclase n=1 Tax=Desulfolutivibrio sulfodismutans TaxID=63561 RepID=A0A7K3NHQ7_9BACT|nr:diguanylate cyclase [Desulfolutivibrio sulfodismutans]NDY55722.1 diguanylate cyclase [Desulfolutivibrio sulfodismutans]QLA13742.1 diguanylate cyclase [Desulfolutivibrio sulfodismutans DSM 3696]
MDTIVRKKIRFFYYTAALVTMAVVALAVSVPYFIDSRKNYDLLISEIENSIIFWHRTTLKQSVTRTISEIETIRSLTRAEFKALCDAQARAFSRLDAQDVQALAAPRHDGSPALRGIPLTLADAGVVIREQATGRVVWTNGRQDADAFAQDGPGEGAAYPVTATAPLPQGLAVTLFFQAASLDALAKARAKALIRAIRFDQGSYIWVNEILNYAGGDNYAIRAVNPNLPETEGNPLSTNTPDIHGNFPYKEELEGINRDGDLYFTYYFKKLGSMEITQKLAYAKLYKPFDWIVATGVYMDDIEAVILKRKLALTEAYAAQVRSFIILMAAVFVVCVTLFYVFERRVNAMVSSFVSRLHENEQELVQKNDRLTAAYTQLEHVAYHDFLTGLLNRHAMSDRIGEEFSRSARSGASFCLILADIDEFKRINDTMGHDVGDQVLAKAANRLRKNLRHEDVAARWGGEEFLILATACTLEKGVILAEKLRAVVEGRPIRVGEAALNVTMTFGVAAYAPGKTFDELLKDVDLRLYDGKRGGRNRVVSDACA